MSYLDDYIPVCKRFEGCVAWMYLDTVAKVTIGVGNMLPDVDAALRLPLRIQSSGDLAGEPAVRAEFARVAAMTPGKLPRFYGGYEALVLNEADTDALLMSRLVGFDAQLQRDFLRYEAYPDTVKLAMLDMAYNLGEVKLAHGYPTFDAAVRSQDWPRAAASSGRNVHDAAFNDRNAWTSQQLLAAVAA